MSPHTQTRRAPPRPAEEAGRMMAPFFKANLCLEDKQSRERSVVDLFDAEAVEAAEASIDQFIERRARQNDEANRLEAAWAESERRVVEKRREANLQQWISFHGHQHRVFLELAAEHADRRSRLMLEAGYEPGEGAA